MTDSSASDQPSHGPENTAGEIVLIPQIKCEYRGFHFSLGASKHILASEKPVKAAISGDGMRWQFVLIGDTYDECIRQAMIAIDASLKGDARPATPLTNPGPVLNADEAEE